jgi:hypothetical protein
LQAGNGLNLTDTTVRAEAALGGLGGTITLSACSVSIRGGLFSTQGNFTGGGMISITGKNSVFVNSTILSADGGAPTSIGTGRAGTILINGGSRLRVQQSTISAKAEGNGGTIQLEANKIELTNTQLTTSTLGGPGTVGGSIPVNAKNTTLTNSQILSTATEGQGGNINITSPVLHQASSVIDASSQFGTNGTVTINGIIQP